jgi:flagellar protein FlbT
MALLVHIKRGGRLFVNGAVLENASGRTTSVLLRNEATIMRGEDILPPAEATSPATRIYSAIQGAYLFPERREALIALALALGDAFERAAPSAAAIVAELRAAVAAARLYAALKPCKALIEHEYQALAELCEQAGELRPRPAPRLSGTSTPCSQHASGSAMSLAKLQRGAGP